MAIKLFNKGERTIIIGEFHFAPQQVGSFTQEAANKLLRLYADEVVDINAQTTEQEAAETSESAEEEKTTAKAAKTAKK